jgi:hypothetical protein
MGTVFLAFQVHHTVPASSIQGDKCKIKTFSAMYTDIKKGASG